MKNVLKVAACCFFALLLSVTFMSADVFAETEMEAKAMLKEAKGNRAKAAEVGGEWRDVGKMIKKAKKALKKGDYKRSVKLAKRAAEQGQLGYEQMVRQKGKVGNPSFLN